MSEYIKENILSSPIQSKAEFTNDVPYILSFYRKRKLSLGKAAKLARFV
jgi:predicted HTH domain antitoxin